MRIRVFSVVSIPFKREILSELVNEVCSPFPVNIVSIPFKREILSEYHHPYLHSLRSTVSIPFKREILSEQGDYFEKFCFTHVSIPFKREILSELICGIIPASQKSFHSLQTGNTFRTEQFIKIIV